MGDHQGERETRVMVRFLREYTTCFGRLTWRAYQDEAGNSVSVCVRGLFAKGPKSQGWSRSLARRKLRRLQGGAALMAAYRHSNFRSRKDNSGAWPVVAIAGALLLGGAGAKGAAHHPHPAAAHPAAANGTAAQVITFARDQLGKPYLWGGTGPGAFDCSGLAMEAYASAGITIDRTSQQQWATLPHVTSLRPGDLIFYAGADGTVSSPGHVVIYIGGGKVIQAYATGWPVMVSSLSSMNAGALTGYARPS
jgi:cell wall-associated NlpC family hydrolase